MMHAYQGKTTLEVLEWAKNYNKWIVSNFSAFVKSPFIEIGAGMGTISDHFLDRKKVHITDSDTHLVGILQKKYKSKNNVIVQTIDITKPIPKSMQNKFSSVLLVNVLEHIENDSRALKNIFALLKPSGKLLLLVPAKQFAFTKLDASLGHKRRYEKDQLKNKLLSQGFVINHMYFFNIVGLLSWWMRAKIERNHKELKGYQIKFFEMVVPVLRVLEDFKKPPVGISLIAVVTKP